MPDGSEARQAVSDSLFGLQLRKIREVEPDTIVPARPAAFSSGPCRVERIEQHQQRNLFPLRPKLLGHLVGNHTIGAPTRENVRTLRLKLTHCLDLPRGNI